MSIPQEGAVSPQEDAGSSNVRVTFVSRLLGGGSILDKGGFRFWSLPPFDSGQYPLSILVIALICNQELSVTSSCLERELSSTGSYHKQPSRPKPRLSRVCVVPPEENTCRSQESLLGHGRRNCFTFASEQNRHD